jgi:glycosyltransferase involved in cell wall biosynthesis
MRLYFGPLLRLGHVWIAASSDADRTLLLGDAPYLASLTTTIPNAIPLERLLSLDRDPIPGRVVSIGRMAPNKALTDLVRALARVHDVEWSLLLAGERDPEELAHITAETDRLMVRDRVTFVFGFGDEELPRLLSSAALAAFPSKGEGFGIALLEAMAAGVPVLARRIPAHELLLGDDLADGLVDFSDPDAAADAISGLLTADRDELAGLSTRLRARAADFGIGRLQSQIEELYTRLRVRAHAEGRP